MKRQYKVVLWVMLSLLIIIAGWKSSEIVSENTYVDNVDDSRANTNIHFLSKATGNRLSVLRDGKWNEIFIQGVNVGAGKPGAFPGEVAITYDEYFRWFTYITEMNANTIRVYTILRPQFYNALFDFNQQRENEGKTPLYVIHGVWINENDIATIEDAFGEENKIVNDVISSGKDIVDIIHGNKYLPLSKGNADGTYTTNISEYVIGWILGIEWDPSFVSNTNENNPERMTYEGKYLYTKDASPFEVFLAQMGDQIIEYESTAFHLQRPVAFSNWVTTDPLTHPNEPYVNEDLVEVNVEHIFSHESYKPGMFVSYHVYPYYPDSFSFQTDYITYIGTDGKPNPYLAYLEDLQSFHSMPIVISEFGIPASRGKAHENRVTGFNQGFIDEVTQGEMLLHMLRDMHTADLAGGIAFSWQDEWFKRTWNNNDLDVRDSRPFWSNTQTNEQHFGLLAFDPGEAASRTDIDGKVSDWTADSLFYTDDRKQMFVKSDEAYVYIRVDATNYDFYNDLLIIPIDTINGQGNTTYQNYDMTFNKGADFVLKVHGLNDTRLLVDAYYDNYYFRYAILTDLIEKNSAFQKKNSGIFNPIRLALNKKIVIPIENTVIPFTGYETGKLVYGISDPTHRKFNSLSDFYYADGHLEIRIPWQLLNVMDPSKKMVIDDMHVNGLIAPIRTTGLNMGMIVVKEDSTNELHDVDMKEYVWDSWEQPKYHERLKSSYYILQKGMAELLEKDGSQ
ncbi:family 2 glycosyl transferase [Sporosarcina sp. PTS2304]|uniref:family 2 glycosyl transferase n=1 Tax=Sporosarcina sp. PTS2304 TaxID=2283194 RepID=UPI000E0D5156|nr:family 2 glycosyl transferase [Sporosarcina sp. PTS2304]AXI00208.1 family 2 glycosyl transferase [Sporosarcina sp. PTS2304]